MRGLLGFRWFLRGCAKQRCFVEFFRIRLEPSVIIRQDFRTSLERARRLPRKILLGVIANPFHKILTILAKTTVTEDRFDLPLALLLSILALLGETRRSRLGLGFECSCSSTCNELTSRLSDRGARARRRGRRRGRRRLIRIGGAIGITEQLARGGHTTTGVTGRRRHSSSGSSSVSGSGRNGTSRRWSHRWRPLLGLRHRCSCCMRGLRCLCKPCADLCGSPSLLRCQCALRCVRGGSQRACMLRAVCRLLHRCTSASIVDRRRPGRVGSRRGRVCICHTEQMTNFPRKSRTANARRRRRRGSTDSSCDDGRNRRRSERFGTATARGRCGFGRRSARDESWTRQASGRLWGRSRSRSSRCVCFNLWSCILGGACGLLCQWLRLVRGGRSCVVSSLLMISSCGVCAGSSASSSSIGERCCFRLCSLGGAFGFKCGSTLGRSRCFLCGRGRGRRGSRGRSSSSRSSSSSSGRIRCSRSRRSFSSLIGASHRSRGINF